MQTKEKNRTSSAISTCSTMVYGHPLQSSIMRSAWHAVSTYDASQACIAQPKGFSNHRFYALICRASVEPTWVFIWNQNKSSYAAANNLGTRAFVDVNSKLGCSGRRSCRAGRSVVVAMPPNFSLAAIPSLCQAVKTRQMKPEILS
jgi:hypothetical protein